MHEMAAEPWTPSPVRRVLLEAVNFFHGFGNTKYASLFRETYQASQKVPIVQAHLGSQPTELCVGLFFDKY